MSGIQVEIRGKSFDCYIVPRKRPLGNIHGHVLTWDAVTKHNAKEVKAMCYLKFLDPPKQWDLYRGKLLQHYVDLNGDGVQYDLCRVEWACDFSSSAHCVRTVPHLSYTLDPTLLL